MTIDKQRQFRFVIPPFIFVAHLMLGAYLTNRCDERLLEAWFKSPIMQNGIALLTAGGVGIVAIGFILTNTSILVVRFLFFLFQLVWPPQWQTSADVQDAEVTSKRAKGMTVPEASRIGNQYSYEAYLDGPALSVIRDKILCPHSLSPRDALYSAATFGLRCLSSDARDWIFRRWSTFNIAWHSLFAIAIAWLVGPHIGISGGWPWNLWTGGFGIVLALAASIAWYETRRMFLFSAQLPCSGRCGLAYPSKQSLEPDAEYWDDGAENF